MMDLSVTGWGGMNWIHLSHGRDQWRALVNMGNKLSGSISIKCSEILQ
jgi:hypothetical protein